MNNGFGYRSARIALVVTAVAIALLVSPATREYIITTAHAAAQRVLVVNRENRPVPTIRAEEPFQVRVAVSMNTADLYGANTFPVPANTRFVLENIGARGVSPGVKMVEVSQPNGSAFLLPQPVNVGSYSWAGTTQTKVIFQAGNVTVSVRRPAGGGSTIYNYVTLTGYLIPN